MQANDEDCGEEAGTRSILLYHVSNVSACLDRILRLEMLWLCDGSLSGQATKILAGSCWHRHHKFDNP